MTLPFALFPPDPPHPDARDSIDACPACGARYPKPWRNRAACKACGLKVAKSDLDGVFRTAAQECAARRAWSERLHAKQLNEMREYARDTGLTVVATVISAGDDRDCPACRADAGVNYLCRPGGDAPRLPHVDCTCGPAGWCRCSFTFDVRVTPS